MNNMTRSLRSSYVLERQEHFNQVVANVYARQLDQNIPWHSDRNPLLADDTDICSLTLGAANSCVSRPARMAPFAKLAASLKSGRRLRDGQAFKALSH